MPAGTQGAAKQGEQARSHDALVTKVKAG